MSKNSDNDQKNDSVNPGVEITPLTLEALRISKGETFVKNVCDCVKSFVKWGSIFGCFYFIYKSVESVVTGVTGIADRLSDVLEAVCLDHFIYLMAILLLGVGNSVRRFRNRRLTKQVGNLRHEIENGETANTRSGLDPHGESADDKE